MDDIWQILMEERSTGVTTGIYYLSDQIEKSLVLQTFTQPLAPVRLPQEVHLPEKSSPWVEIVDDVDLDFNGDGEEWSAILPASISSELNRQDASAELRPVNGNLSIITLSLN